MNLVKFIEFLRNHLKTVVRICFGVLALLMAFDALFVSKAEAHTAIERQVPAFWSIFGFFGCVAIIILSKWFGHAGIMQPEDYYEDEQPVNDGRSHPQGRNHHE